MHAQQSLLALSHLPALSCHVCFREMLMLTHIQIKLSQNVWERGKTETEGMQNEEYSHTGERDEGTNPRHV